MAAQKSNQDSVIVMVLLDEPAFPSVESLAKRLEQRLGSSQAITWDNPSDKDGISLQFLYVGGRRVDLVLMPIPIPWNDLEGPCATNRIWPGATTVCKAHKAHVLVRVPGSREDGPASLRLLTTKIVASLVEELSAPAVYWGAGTVVNSGADFVKMAGMASDTEFPLLLWVDFRIWRQEDGSLYLATTGLSDLGLMEFEGASRRLPAKVLLEKVFDLSHYVCERGPVVKDGDTVGTSASERITAKYRRSIWGREEVIYLEFDGAEKKGFFARLFGR